MIVAEAGKEVRKETGKETGNEVGAFEITLSAQRRLAELAVKTGRLIEAIDEYEQLLRE